MSVSAVGLDPYFMNAYGSPNANYQSLIQQYSAGSGGTSSISGTGVDSTAFRGVATGGVQTPTTTASEGSSATPWVLTGLVASGAAATILACKGKSAGAKGLWNQIKTGWNQVFKSGSKEAAANATNKTTEGFIDNSVTVRTVKGKNVVTVPDRVRVIGSNTTPGYVSAQAEQLGINTADLAWNGEGAKLQSTWVSFKQGDTEVKAFYDATKEKFERVYGVSKGAKKGTQLDTVGDLGTKLDEIAASLKQGKVPGDGVNLLNTRYYKIADDSMVRYNANFANRTIADNANVNVNGLRSITTNRYLATDDAVQALKFGDTSFAKSFRPGEKGFSDAWVIGSAKYRAKGLPNSTQIAIKNGEINGVYVDNKFYGLETDKFKAIANKHETIFKETPNKILGADKDRFADLVYRKV